MTPLSAEAVKRVEELSGKAIVCEELDCRNQEALESIMGSEKVTSVIHFAGLKAVGESVQKPQLYFDVNLGATNALLGAMESTGVKRLIFSSSATVYGDQNTPPLDESMPTPIEGAQNPYGLTKWFVLE